jgi:hypothetical protein
MNAEIAATRHQQKDKQRRAAVFAVLFRRKNCGIKKADSNEPALYDCYSESSTISRQKL